MNHVTHRLSSADISFFQRKSANFAISRNADIDCILIHNFEFFSSSLFNFSWVFKDFNKHGYNFDDVSKNG